VCTWLLNRAQGEERETIYMCVCMYVYTCVYIHVYICIYICMYTSMQGEELPADEIWIAPRELEPHERGTGERGMHQLVDTSSASGKAPVLTKTNF
jgi:hypothetical protein